MDEISVEVGASNLSNLAPIDSHFLFHYSFSVLPWNTARSQNILLGKFCCYWLDGASVGLKRSQLFSFILDCFHSFFFFGCCETAGKCTVCVRKCIVNCVLRTLTYASFWIYSWNNYEGSVQEKSHGAQRNLKRWLCTPHFFLIFASARFDEKEDVSLRFHIGQGKLKKL